MACSKSRWWFVTTGDVEFDWEGFVGRTGGYVFVGSLEKSKEGTPHKHVCLYFRNARGSIKSIRTLLAREGMAQDLMLDIQVMKGGLAKAKAYATKEAVSMDEIFEFGTPPAQGKRTDIESLCGKIAEGRTSSDEVALTNPEFFHQYGRTLQKVEDIVLRKKFRTEMTQGIWYWGESGAGKSHKAFEDYDVETHYVFPNDGGWWDGYCGQETVIINEFRGGIAYAELLDLVDKWPKVVRRRGREPVPFLAKTLIVTSVLTPGEVYSNLAQSDSLDQLLRRFEITHIEGR